MCALSTDPDEDDLPLPLLLVALFMFEPFFAEKTFKERLTFWGIFAFSPRVRREDCLYAKAG